MVYDGIHSDGRAWFTRGDGSLLRTQTAQRGVRQIGFGQQLYDNYSYNASDYHMQIDDEYADQEPQEDQPQKSSAKPSSSSHPESSHSPSPLYVAYYTKASEIPEEQLPMFTSKDFSDELPEEPPPFEHCYAEGDTPKQFAPKPVN